MKDKDTNTHVTGGITQGKGHKPAQFPLKETYERCNLETMNTKQVYDSFKEYGFFYGPEFQRVHQILKGDEEVLAILSPPPTNKAQRFDITLMDACFQITITALGEGQDTYLPVLIKEFNLYGTIPTNTQLIAYAKITHQDPRSMQGDVYLMDSNGTVFAEIFGFTGQCISDEGRADLKICLYPTAWQTKASQLPDITPNLISDESDESLAKEIEKLETLSKYIPEVNKLVCYYAKLAVSATPPEQVHQRQKKYYARLSEYAAQAPDNVDKPMVDALYKKLMEEIPYYEIELTSVKNIGDIIPAALRDPAVSLPILYAPDGLARFFKDSVSVQYYYEVAARVIAKAAEIASKKQTVRILEIGSRMGGLASKIVPRIADIPFIEYIFTDITSSFFPHAQMLLGKYTFVKYRMLDIEKDPEQQHFLGGVYDIVIVMDTLHTVPHAKVALNNSLKLVAPDGWIVVLEPTKRNPLADLVFGCLELWWAFNDFRKESCVIDRATWRNLFREAGVDSLADFSVPSEFAHSIFVGRKPQSIRFKNTKRWVVERDSKHGMWKEFENGVGKDSIVASWTKEEARPNFREKLKQIIRAESKNERPLAFLMLWSLDNPFQTNDIILDFVDHIQIFEELHNNEQLPYPQLTIVTEGGQYECENPNAAVIVGFVRTLVNEMYNMTLNTVDLEVGYPVPDSAQLLLRYISGDFGSETEITFRKGKLIVPRLLQASENFSDIVLPKDIEIPTPKSFKAQELAYELCIPANALGDLSQLQLYKRYLPQLGNTEVLIRVGASGLNFRDVMMALGLLSELTDDVSLGMDTGLGLECAGVIEAVGRDVTKYKVGDPVIAFASRCIGNFTIVDVNSIAPKPKTVSIEEAAGIPVVFVTAYYTLIKLANIDENDVVLIHSAMGGVGQAAIQLCKWKKATVIATAGSEDKRKILKEKYGAAFVADSRSTTWADEIRSFTKGKGVTVVLNSLSGENIMRGISLLQAGGRFIEIGKRDILANKSISLRPLFENKSFFSAHLDLLLKNNPMLIEQLLGKVVQLFNEKVLSPIQITVRSLNEARETFLFMAQGKHTGKIVFRIPDNSKEISSKILGVLDFASHGTYFISGGFGGIGLAVAQWLASKGARHLVLFSRNGPKSAKAHRTVKNLQDRGVHIIVAKGDITKVEDVKAAMVLPSHFPPLKGVFHLAMVLVDGLTTHVPRDQIPLAVDPKVKGCWALHEATKNLPLDIFFMASSIVGVLGGLEQANYSGANTFMDAFAMYRVRQGLPALALQLGAIRGVGFLERNKVAARITKLRGFRTLHIDEVLQTMEKLITDSFEKPIPVLMLANQNWGVFSEAKDNSRFSQNIPEDTASALSQQGTTLSREEMEQRMKKQLADILCIPIDQIQSDQPMVGYGVDSLMSVELVNWVRREFNIKTTQMDVLGGLSINDLLNMANQTEVTSIYMQPGAAQAEEFTCLKKNDMAEYLMICFPYMAGDEKAFKAWPDELKNCEVYVATNRGIDFDDKLDQLAKGVKALVAKKPHQKVVFYGHSMGGHLSYHLTQRLLGVENITPAGLIVGASPAPIPSSGFLAGLGEWSPSIIQKATVEELINSQISQGNLPVGFPVNDVVGEYLRKDLLLLKNYDMNAMKYAFYTTKVPSIHAIAGKEDLKVPVFEIEAWKQFCNYYKFIQVPGGHLFIETNSADFFPALRSALTEL
jgi:NADPH:quinone reductase-like Zn-dependent oxidoreductase/surfactin synthase thioesterase subunit/SAM-dependent methyltransferase/acyl carrier protein